MVQSLHAESVKILGRTKSFFQASEVRVGLSPSLSPRAQPPQPRAPFMCPPLPTARAACSRPLACGSAAWLQVRDSWMSVAEASSVEEMVQILEVQVRHTDGRLRKALPALELRTERTEQLLQTLAGRMEEMQRQLSAVLGSENNSLPSPEPVNVVAADRLQLGQSGGNGKLRSDSMTRKRSLCWSDAHAHAPTALTAALEGQAGDEQLPGSPIAMRGSGEPEAVGSPKPSQQGMLAVPGSPKPSQQGMLAVPAAAARMTSPVSGDMAPRTISSVQRPVGSSRMSRVAPASMAE